MKNNVPCALIRDLVPLYAEDLVSDETRKELEAHIQECKECKAYYERATKEMECEKVEEIKQEAMEINYMKRIHAYQKRNALLGGIVSFLLGVFLPVGLLGLSVFVMQGGPSAYHFARLELMWPLMLARMLVSGIVVCIIYCIINRVIRKRWGSKK